MEWKSSLAGTKPPAQPEPGLTPEELLRRAVALRPYLRERQAECERMGRVLPEVHDRLMKEGFYRIIQPRRFGGYEFDMPTFLKVMMEVSRGCSETGWVLALTAGHPLLAALFPEECQTELYGKDGEFRGPSSFNPPGTAVPVEGGYRVSLSIPSASGIDSATHFITMSVVAATASEPERAVLMILHPDQYTIVDDWQVMGMRGTGSKRVVAKDVFVPDYRTAPMRGIGNVTQMALPGPQIYGNPFYRGRIGAFLIGETASVALGAARGALDLYEDLLQNKASPYPPYLERYKDPEFQHHYGRALALIATGEAALIRVGQEYMEYAQEAAAGGAPFSDERDQKLVLIEQQCIGLAWEALNIIYKTAGTSASVKEGQPIGRFFRNVAAINTHPALQIDRMSVAAARTRFGLAAEATRPGR